MRHRLVHDYDGTNWSIISDVVFEELPELIQEMRKLI
ncbi:MAG: HepT-like ribonuclease domain-containing protein [Ruminiclostridium sp.]